MFIAEKFVSLSYAKQETLSAFFQARPNGGPFRSTQSQGQSQNHCHLPPGDGSLPRLLDIKDIIPPNMRDNRILKDTGLLHFGHLGR